MGNKWGFHSGVGHMKDCKVSGDLYVQDDIVFSDVSAGVLGVTGGIDMQSTVSAIGIDLGGTFATSAISIDGSTAIGINLTGITATTGAIMCGTGTSARQTMAEAEDFVLGIYTTCADTDGSNTAKPLYVNAQYSGAGQVARAAEFVLYPTAKLGGWANALKAYTDFSGDNDGGTTGLASSACLEMKLPNGATNGAFYPLEIEWVGQASTSFGAPGTGSQSGFMILNASGTVTDFDDDGVFFSVNGLTAATDHLLSANSQTLKCDISSGTTRYLVLSQLQDALSLDSCATAITLGDNVTTTGIQIGNVPTGILLDGTFTTGINMVGSTSYNPIVIGTKSSTTQVGLTMTGVLDNTSGVMIFADDGDAQLGTSYITSPIWTRYMLFHNQTSVTPTGAYFQLKAKKSGGITFATSDVSATKVYLELDSAVTVASGSLAIINAGLTMNGAVTDTAEALSGIDVNINDGGDALSTTKASTGVRIRKTSGSTGGFPIGLGIEDAGSTIGISIGTCTTSIYFGTPSSEFFSFVDDDTFAADAGDKGNTPGGYITVKVGSATRYINLVTGA